MPMRARMSSIMGQIEAEHLELFALEFGKIAESVYTLASTNIDQSAPNLVKMYMTIRSRMNSIMDLNCLSYLPLNLQKMLNLTATANVDQLVPNMVLMYVTVRSCKSSIINLIGTEWSELSSLYLKKNVIIFDFVYIKSIICKYRTVYIDQSAPNLVKIFISNGI